MKYLFHLGHPAHFHLFKFVIKELKNAGHDIYILIKKKDVLEDLLKENGLKYKNLLPKGRKDSTLGIAWGLLEADIKMLHFARRVKPDVMIGTSIVITHVGKLLGIPTINVNEDDAVVVSLYSKLSYPWSTVILSPSSCNNGKWEKKSIKYNSYHELAYLHSNHFTPDKSVVEKYFSVQSPFFILRFARLKAHHDSGIKGINTQIANRLIHILSPHGRVYITSERELEPELEVYRMAIDPLDMHHVMAFASLYIGDSQTMAAEAGVLGTPFIRFNDFVGKISYLNELELNYELGYGFKSHLGTDMLNKVKELLLLPNLKELWQEKRQNMLANKIDTAKFLTWFIENYPTSVGIMKETPEYQFNFR